MRRNGDDFRTITVFLWGGEELVINNAACVLNDAINGQSFEGGIVNATVKIKTAPVVWFGRVSVSVDETGPVDGTNSTGGSATEIIVYE